MPASLLLNHTNPLLFILFNTLIRKMAFTCVTSSWTHRPLQTLFVLAKPRSTICTGHTTKQTVRHFQQQEQPVCFSRLSMHLVFKKGEVQPKRQHHWLYGQVVQDTSSRCTTTTRTISTWSSVEQKSGFSTHPLPCVVVVLQRTSLCVLHCVRCERRVSYHGQENYEEEQEVVCRQRVSSWMIVLTTCEGILPGIPSNYFYCQSYIFNFFLVFFFFTNTMICKWYQRMDSWDLEFVS